MTYAMVKSEPRGFGCASAGCLCGNNGLGCTCRSGALSGFGVWNTSTAKSVLAQANAAISQAIPQPVIAMINASPLNATQKSWLKREPLSFVLVIGDWAHDIVIAFINRTQAKSKKGEIYKVGGRRVVVKPRKTDTPARLMAQALTVSFHNPVEAAIVIAQLHLEVASGAFNMIGAGVQSTAQSVVTNVQTGVTNVSNAAKSAQNAVDDSVRAAQQAAQSTFNTVTSWFSGLGEPATVTAVAATTVPVGATVAGGTAITGETLLFSALATLISLAPIIVPALIDMAADKPPVPPTTLQVAEAGSPYSLSSANVARASAPPAVFTAAAAQNSAADSILGLPRTAVYVGGAALGFGGLLLLLFKSKKKK